MISIALDLYLHEGWGEERNGRISWTDWILPSIKIRNLHGDKRLKQDLKFELTMFV